MVSKRVLISGKVQGVWYRAWTEKNAKELQLKGWVKNLPNGCVEALFVGADSEVTEMLTRLHSGPPNAHVSGVEVLEEKEAPDDEVLGFKIVR